MNRAGMTDAERLAALEVEVDTMPERIFTSMATVLDAELPGRVRKIMSDHAGGFALEMATAVPRAVIRGVASIFRSSPEAKARKAEHAAAEAEAEHAPQTSLADQAKAVQSAADRKSVV